MPQPTLIAQDVRVPALPMGPITDKEGNPTDNELLFRTQLITSLQKNFNNEGLIAPTQTNLLADPIAVNNFHIRQIQNARIPDPITFAPGAYSCGFGRFLYDVTNNRILVSIDGGGGIPAFMEVTLTVPVPPV